MSRRHLRFTSSLRHRPTPPRYQHFTCIKIGTLLGINFKNYLNLIICLCSILSSCREAGIIPLGGLSLLDKFVGQPNSSNVRYFNDSQNLNTICKSFYFCSTCSTASSERFWTSPSLSCRFPEAMLVFKKLMDQCHNVFALFWKYIYSRNSL